VDFIRQVEYGDLPKLAIEKAKMHLLDCLGVSIGAYNTPWARAVVNVVKEYGGKEEARIFVEGDKVPAPNAALANGTLAHSLEFDDTHILSTCHPAAPIIPSALAIAESQRSNGKEVILSIILGYEVMLRVGMAVFPDHRDDRGFHITSTTGNLGAAIAAAKLLDLDARAFPHALALAGDQSASGLFAFINDGSMSKRIHAGRAAMNGILSALLAQKGVTGGTRILEDECFLKAYTSDYDLNKLTANLGQDFEIMNCWCKQFPCCGHLQGLIRLALGIKSKHTLKSENIECISVGTYDDALIHNKYEINTPLDAQESASFAVAAALVRGDAYLEEFLERYDDPRILALMRRIDGQVDQDVRRGRGAKLLVKMRNGEEFEGIEREAITIGDQAIIEKFQRLTKDTLPRRNIEKIINVIQDLEEEENMEALMQLTSAKKEV